MESARSQENNRTCKEPGCTVTRICKQERFDRGRTLLFEIFDNGDSFRVVDVRPMNVNDAFSPRGFLC